MSIVFWMATNDEMLISLNSPVPCILEICSDLQRRGYAIASPYLELSDLKATLGPKFCHRSLYFRKHAGKPILSRAR